MTRRMVGSLISSSAVLGFDMSQTTTPSPNIETRRHRVKRYFLSADNFVLFMAHDHSSAFPQEAQGRAPVAGPSESHGRPVWAALGSVVERVGR